MGHDPTLGRLKILLGHLLFLFCENLQRVKLAESNKNTNAMLLHSSQPLLHFVNKKLVQ